MFITPYGAKENAAAGMMMEVVQQDAGIILIVRKLPSFGVWIDEKYEKMNLMDRFLRSCAYENIH